MARARDGFQREKQAVDDNKAGVLREKSGSKKTGWTADKHGSGND
jgi:hypothetical protein